MLYPKQPKEANDHGGGKWCPCASDKFKCKIMDVPASSIWTTFLSHELHLKLKHVLLWNYLGRCNWCQDHVLYWDTSLQLSVSLPPASSEVLDQINPLWTKKYKTQYNLWKARNVSVMHTFFLPLFPEIAECQFCLRLYHQDCLSGISGPRGQSKRLEQKKMYLW